MGHVWEKCPSWWRAFSRKKPPRPKYTDIWDMSIVLSHPQSLSPLHRLSLKELTLKLLLLILLLSGQRGQTLHLLSIDHMVFSHNCYTFEIVEHSKQSRPGVNNPLVKLKAFEDKSPFVVSTLQEYLTRTQTLRGSESQMFISYQRSFKKVVRSVFINRPSLWRPPVYKMDTVLSW